MTRLSRRFFSQPTLKVAEQLLGKKIVCQGKTGFITETEAYIGCEDPACHAARGQTGRNEVMFGPPGHVYIYLIYGMYYCLNFVTERNGFPAAVLIRGIQTEMGRIDGPGKVCRYFGLTRKENGIDLATSEDFYVTRGRSKPEFKQTGRIGIRAGREKMWRFVSLSS